MPASQPKLYDVLKRAFHAVSAPSRSRLSEPEITRAFVPSRSIATLGHDETRHCLQVEYFNGALYRVDGVSEAQYRNLLDAHDFDRAFQHEIIGNHPMTRIGWLAPVFG